MESAEDWPPGPGTSMTRHRHYKTKLLESYRIDMILYAKPEEQIPILSRSQISIIKHDPLNIFGNVEALPFVTSGIISPSWVTKSMASWPWLASTFIHFSSPNSPWLDQTENTLHNYIHDRNIIYPFISKEYSLKPKNTEPSQRYESQKMNRNCCVRF